MRLNDQCVAGKYKFISINKDINVNVIELGKNIVTIIFLMQLSKVSVGALALIPHFIL